MIAVKNLQHLNEILLQERLLQAVANHYMPLVSDKKIVKLLEEIVKVSQDNHKDLLDYMKGDLGKKPLKPNAGVLNK